MPGGMNIADDVVVESVSNAPNHTLMSIIASLPRHEVALALSLLLVESLLVKIKHSLSEIHMHQYLLPLRGLLRPLCSTLHYL